MTRIQQLFAVSLTVSLLALGCSGGGDSQTATTDTGAGDGSAATSGGAATQTGSGSAAAATATVKGKILYAGAPVTHPKIKMAADPYCETANHAAVFDSSTIVGPNGELENVFVYVKSGLEGKTFPTPAETVVFDQRNCTYHPHIFGIMTNQKLEIINSDATLHNVHAAPVNSQEFNVGMPTQGMKISKSFKKSEVMVHIKCEVHPWMSAYCGVLDHPYFTVAGAGGTYELPKLPAGTYTLEAWHEKLGTQTQEVTVGENGVAEAVFNFGTAGEPAGT